MVISQLVFLALDRASSNKGGKLGSSGTRLVPEQNVQIKKKKLLTKQSIYSMCCFDVYTSDPRWGYKSWCVL